MRRVPKHKVILIAGIVLFAASPFLFFLTPEWLFQPLLCVKEDVHELFGCAGKTYTASFYLSLAVFVAGIILMLWALRGDSHRR